MAFDESLKSEKAGPAPGLWFMDKAEDHAPPPATPRGHADSHTTPRGHASPSGGKARDVDFAAGFVDDGPSHHAAAPAPAPAAPKGGSWASQHANANLRSGIAMDGELRMAATELHDHVYDLGQDRIRVEVKTTERDIAIDLYKQADARHRDLLKKVYALRAELNDHDLFADEDAIAGKLKRAEGQLRVAEQERALANAEADARIAEALQVTNEWSRRVRSILQSTLSRVQGAGELGDKVSRYGGREQIVYAVQQVGGLAGSLNLRLPELETLNGYLGKNGFGHNSAEENKAAAEELANQDVDALHGDTLNKHLDAAMAQTRFAEKALSGWAHLHGPPAAGHYNEMADAVDTIRTHLDHAQELLGQIKDPAKKTRFKAQVAGVAAAVTRLDRRYGADVSSGAPGGVAIDVSRLGGEATELKEAGGLHRPDGKKRR